jgi:hypothetical protein
LATSEKLQLPDVTLVAVTSVNIDEANFALQHSLSRIAFGSVRLLCSKLPAKPDPQIRYCRIPQINLGGYNWVMLRKLHEEIETSHCLLVQADGFVLAPERWEPEFLDYDYIGAPWPPEIYVQQNPPWALQLANRVGNGGFSLRSKRLLEATARVPIEAISFPVMSEDVVICHYLYDSLCAQGIKFAPLDMAARFAIETEGAVPGSTVETVFGFHGKHLLEKVEHLIVRDRPCLCGSGKRFADCHGRLWKT